MPIETSLIPAVDEDASAPWFEASIPELDALMASGEMTAVGLTEAYLGRIDRLDPILHAVI